ncbi:fungal specific transcription factor [Penicillium coprophilum]|uniref:fungal specific transcription factor n=1 Tax=Penicillium coprophilum TaxID=36646 RepID=UPI002384371D|nr:fungal specific transcription factor [Penicillium coprophilum]KAJ5154406.1 fungal specific transcription factor [Penicillium coprophilum]
MAGVYAASPGPTKEQNGVMAQPEQTVLFMNPLLRPHRELDLELVPGQIVISVSFDHKVNVPGRPASITNTARCWKMSSKAPGNPKRRTRTVRHKVALACDSCREKKIRCDGNKPICGPCTRRSYRIDQCVYNTENSRSASKDEYFHTLHQRIRELEDARLKDGVSTQTPINPQSQLRSETNRQVGIPAEATGFSPCACKSLPGATAQNPPPRSTEAGVPACPRPPAARSHCDNSRSALTGEATAESYESPLFDEGEGHVTGMGQITASAAEGPRRSARFQFYGSSSTASLMRFAWQSMPSQPISGSRAEPVLSRLQDTSTVYRFDDFNLPPRMLADHLLKCFFDKVYILYPFFHRQAFEAAYQNIWRTEDESCIPLTDLRIGLGSSFESGPQSIVFHCALNLMFALGCHFADIAPEEVELVAHSFFLRAKGFIGLDFLEFNTLGVVQTLLITALYLQSSPYPSRCWNSVGVACRVALGLGLHEPDTLATSTPLEVDIRRRTWHGCVMMDITLSMTYGRPSMTTHLAPLRSPRDPNNSSSQEGTGEPSLITFYEEAIHLHDILDKILSDVYNACRGRSPQHRSQQATKSPGGLDTVLDIERQLTLFEANLPSFLKYPVGPSVVYADREANLAIAQQRNVLHARYIHFHLLLYRPIFTQLYSERVRTREPATGPELQENWMLSATARSTLYSSMSSKCATSCVMAAIDLTHLVHETYQTNAADAWWYNGFYVSTAAIVLLMSFSAPSMLEPITMEKAREAWREAMRVLEFMAPFHRSASNTLQFLQAAYRQAVPGSPHQTGPKADASQLPSEIPQSNDPLDQPDTDSGEISFFNWEEFTANVGSGLDDLGFLTRLDFPDTLAQGALVLICISFLSYGGSEICNI